MIFNLLRMFSIGTYLCFFSDSQVVGTFVIAECYEISCRGNWCWLTNQNLFFSVSCSRFWLGRLRLFRKPPCCITKRSQYIGQVWTSLLTYGLTCFLMLVNFLNRPYCQPGSGLHPRCIHCWSDYWILQAFWRDVLNFWSRHRCRWCSLPLGKVES